MKIIILIALMLNTIFAMPLYKIYTFMSYEQDDKENDTLVYKMSTENTFDISDTSFAFVESIASSIEENDKSDDDWTLRELYYDKYFLNELFNLRLGRSIRTLDFTNTYSVVDFLSSSSNLGDTNDRTLIKAPLDGLSFTLNDITNETINQYLSLHIYSENIIDDEKKDNQKYLLEMTQSGDKFHQSILLYSDNKEQQSIAMARSETVGDNIIYNATTRYDFGDNSGFSAVTGIEYSPIGDFLIGLESIRLGKNIDGRFEREKKHKEFRSADDSKNYYSDLTSKDYLSLYSRYTWNDTMLIFSWLENTNDSSRRLSSGLNHKFESVEVNLQAINFDGIKNTEFGYIKEQKSYEVKFFVSYLMMN